MAGSGNYQICLQSAPGGIGDLATIDIDPARAQYNPRKPSDHDQDGSPIFQGLDEVVWEFDYVTDALVNLLRPLEGQDVFIRTRMLDKYDFTDAARKKCIFDSFTTRSKSSRKWLTGTAVFVNVENV